VNGIANMPGIGGSLGMCCVCGDGFMTEILLGQKVQIVSVDGFSKDMCIHGKCLKVLKANGTDWRTLPDGPLRQAFAKSAAAVEDNSARDAVGQPSDHTDGQRA
jgi:pantoate kinase